MKLLLTFGLFPTQTNSYQEQNNPK